MERGQSQNQTVEFSTTDLYYAAFLLASGLSFLEHREVGPRRITFVFERQGNELEVLRREWLNGTATINAQSLVNAIKTFKGLCYPK